jgi:SAM-dependent methyltransferase
MMGLRISRNRDQYDGRRDSIRTTVRSAEMNGDSAAGPPSDHAVFEAVVRERLSPSALVLDAGAGSGARHHEPYRETARVVGVDVHPGLATNPNLSHAAFADLTRLPFKAGTFDLVYARYVLEHLDRPLTVFREMRRVLRPGGHFVFQTPNRFHYVAMAARLTPHRFHEWFRARRRSHFGLSAADSHVETFPTRYLANDRRTLRCLAAASGFRVVTMQMIEPRPTYLFFHPLAYRAGEAYRRLITRTDRLADLRCVIVGDLETL